jgi:polysaccharide deacetylase 2 family uncharacterized protein YibQ
MDSVVIIPQGFKNLKMKFKLSPKKKKKKKKLAILLDEVGRKREGEGRRAVY